MTKEEIKLGLLSIKENGATFFDIKMALKELIFNEKLKKEEIARKKHAILTNERVSEFDIKENRDKVFSDIDKILKYFSSKNNVEELEIKNSGFVLGGKEKYIGERHIYIDNVAGSGRIYDTSEDPITTNSVLLYEITFRTSIFGKMSMFSNVISEIEKYFNFEVYYLSHDVWKWTEDYRKKSKNFPTENISFFELSIDINKKEINILYYTSESDIKEFKIENKIKKKLENFGITIDEFDNALNDDSDPIWKKLDSNTILELTKLSGQLIGY